MNTTNEKVLLESVQLESYLINLVDLRNKIAHNNKIIDHKFRNHNKFNSFLHEPYGVLKDSPRNNIFNTFITMKCFLRDQEFIQLNNSIGKRFKKLERKINPLAYNKIVNDLGFTERLPKIEQK